MSDVLMFRAGAHVLMHFAAPLDSVYMVNKQPLPVQQGEPILVVLERGEKYEGTKKEGYGFPGGHFEKGESGVAEQPRDAALRELFEEISVPGVDRKKEPLLPDLRPKRLEILQTITDPKTAGVKHPDQVGTLSSSYSLSLMPNEAKRVMDFRDKLFHDSEFKEKVVALSDQGKGPEFGGVTLVPLKDFKGLGLKFAYRHEEEAVRLLTKDLISGDNQLAPIYDKIKGRHINSVTVFCNANGGNHPAYTEVAYKTGRLLAQNKYRTVYGGGGEDLGGMGQLYVGVRDYKGKSFGVMVRHFENMANTDALITGDEIIVSGMHVRKDRLEREGDAFILLPAGTGMFAEFLDIIDNQSAASRICPEDPCKVIIVVNEKGGCEQGVFDDCYTLLSNMVKKELTSYRKLGMIMEVPTPEEAIKVINALNKEKNPYLLADIHKEDGGLSVLEKFSHNKELLECGVTHPVHELLAEQGVFKWKRPTWTPLLPSQTVDLNVPVVPDPLDT